MALAEDPSDIGTIYIF